MEFCIDYKLKNIFVVFDFPYMNACVVVVVALVIEDRPHMSVDLMHCVKFLIFSSNTMYFC